MKKKNFVVSAIASLVLGMGFLGSAAAEVEPKCSATMGGEVSCEFSNLGAKKDSTCVVIEVTRNDDAKFYSYPSYGGKGAVLSSGKICSGLVEPQDIRERKPEVSWSLQDGTPMPPSKFCSSDNPWIQSAGLLCKTNTKRI